MGSSYSVHYYGEVVANQHVSVAQERQVQSVLGPVRIAQFRLFDDDQFSRNAALQFDARLFGKESEVISLIKEMLVLFNEASGEVRCFGDYETDIRRYVVRERRIYEQRADVSFEHPGHVVFLGGLDE